MTATSQAPRLPLTRDRVLKAAIAYADQAGVEALSMRRLGQELGVEAMSLYNHIANKEDLLDGMVDVVVQEIEETASTGDWKTILRDRILSARQALLRHPWASAVMVTRTNMTPTMMRYMDSVIGILRRGGFSIELAHHTIHVLGSRMLGFAQELYDDTEALEASPEIAAIMLKQMADEYPHITELAMEISHDEGSIVGTGCDDLFEFKFALDLILDGLERSLERT
ncbi:MAG: TetR/AcrR family transcriptional regulator C-terminal domain-containing protein [Acidimicrobiia bacterium]